MAHGTQSCITKLLAGQISIIQAYQESIRIKSALAEASQTQSAGCENLPGLLSTFLKTSIPTNDYSRTWNDPELILFRRLVEYLLENSVLTKDVACNLIALIDRKFTPFLGGSLIHTTREAPHAR